MSDNKYKECKRARKKNLVSITKNTNKLFRIIIDYEIYKHVITDIT